jgi:hypothetical protein
MSATLATPTNDPAADQKENTVLADLLAAVETYPQTYLTVEIYQVQVDDGSAINEDDELTFRVHVHNAGPLNVDNLTLLVEAQEGSTGVKLHGGKAFNPSLTSAVFPQVPGHQKDGDFIDTPDDHYHLKVGKATSTKVDLVKVSIDAWDANPDHIFIAHSDPVPSADDIYSHKILPR